MIPTAPVVSMASTALTISMAPTASIAAVVHAVSILVPREVGRGNKRGGGLHHCVVV